MAEIKINDKLKDRRVSHNNVCAKSIGEHSHYELVQLGICARSSNNKVLLECFSALPSLDELTKMKTDADLKTVKENTLTKEAPAAPATPTEEKSK